MTNQESSASPQPERPLEQRTNIGVDRDGKLKRLVTNPDGTTQVEDFPDLNAAREALLEGQRFHEIVNPPDPDFDHEAFQREHEAAGHPDLDALRENLRDQGEEGRA